MDYPALTDRLKTTSHWRPTAADVSLPS